MYYIHATLFFYHTLTFHLVQMSFSTTQSMHILHGIIWLWHIGHKDISFFKIKTSFSHIGHSSHTPFSSVTFFPIHVTPSIYKIFFNLSIKAISAGNQFTLSSVSLVNHLEALCSFNTSSPETKVHI